MGSHGCLLALKNKAGAAKGAGSIVLSPQERKRKAGAPSCHSESGWRKEERQKATQAPCLRKQLGPPAVDTWPAFRGDP